MHDSQEPGSSALGVATGAARPRYSVVVPCYNEQDSIVPLVEEIAAVVGGDPAFEVVIVDDCSDDETKIRLLQARDQCSVPLRIVSHATNCGQSAAICSGIDVARGEWIATLDGDGQNDPSDIPKLIRVLNDALARPGVPII